MSVTLPERRKTSDVSSVTRFESIKMIYLPTVPCSESRKTVGLSSVTFSESSKTLDLSSTTLSVNQKALNVSSVACTEKCETYKDTCKKHKCNEGLLQSKVQDEHRRMIQEEKRDFLKKTLMVLEARQYGTGTDLQGVRAIQLHSIPGTFQEFIQQSGRGARMCSSHFRCNDNIKFYDWERMLEVHIALNVRLEDICYHCKITKGNKCRRAASYAMQCAPQNPLCAKTDSAANACKTDSCMCFVHIINFTEQFTVGSGSISR